MDKLLMALFEYQKFEDNDELRSVIDSVHSRYAVRELELSEMNLIAAAGVPDQSRKKE